MTVLQSIMDQKPGQQPRRKRSILWSGVRLAVLLAAGLLIVRFSALAESLTFFHPQSTTVVTPAWYEDVRIPTPDGRVLHAWFMPADGRIRQGQRRPAVLHSHGNMGDVSMHAGTSDYLTGVGVSVLLFDYRGFGQSTPQRLLTREELLIDTEAAYQYLKTRDDVDVNRIGTFGYSLGGVFALAMAERHPDVRATVVVAGFSSWPAIAGDVLPGFGQLLIRSGLAPVDMVTKLGQRPLLLVHGQRDTIVPPKHSLILHRAATAAGVPSTLLEVDAHHLNLFTPAVEEQVAEFFRTHLKADD